MYRNKPTTIALFIAAALLASAAPASAQAPQSQPGAQQAPGRQATPPARPGARGPERGRMFDDWGIECETQPDRRELCYAQQTHTQRETGQRIISVSVGYIGANSAPALVVFTPLGVNVASGAAILMDSQPQISMPIQMCVPEGCRATAPITAEQVRALSSARNVTLGFVAWGSEQTTTIAVSVRGLNAALTHLRSAQ